MQGCQADDLHPELPQRGVACDGIVPVPADPVREAHEPLVLGGACDDRHVRLGQRMRLHEPLQHGFRRDEALEIGRELLAALPIRGPAVAGAGEVAHQAQEGGRADRGPHRRVGLEHLLELVQTGQHVGLRHAADAALQPDVSDGEPGDDSPEALDVQVERGRVAHVLNRIGEDAHGRDEARHAEERAAAARRQRERRPYERPAPAPARLREPAGEAYDPPARGATLLLGRRAEHLLECRKEREHDDPGAGEADRHPESHLADGPDVRDHQRREADRRREDRGRAGNELVREREHLVLVDRAPGGALDEARLQVDERRGGGHQDGHWDHRRDDGERPAARADVPHRHGKARAEGQKEGEQRARRAVEHHDQDDYEPREPDEVPPGRALRLVEVRVHVWLAEGVQAA